MEGAYPWGLIKHGESSCCLNSEGKEILHRLWGIFSTLCTCHHTLVFTWWLLTDCWQSCLEKWSASGTGPQTRFAWTENASELPGSFKPRVSGATSTVILTHVSLPGAAWCPNSQEWSMNTTDSEPSRVFIKHGDPWAPAQTYGVRIPGRGPLESHRVEKSSGWLWEVNLRFQDVKYWPFQF